MIGVVSLLRAGVEDNRHGRVVLLVIYDESSGGNHLSTWQLSNIFKPAEGHCEEKSALNFFAHPFGTGHNRERLRSNNYL